MTLMRLARYPASASTHSRRGDTIKRTTLLLLMLVALFVAACTNDQGASPSASASASEEPLDESPQAIPSLDMNGDAELASRFPETVGGEPLLVQSMRGETILSVGESPELENLLETLDARPEDLSLAVGVTAARDVQVTAFRIVGTSQGSLETQFLQSIEALGDTTGFDRVSVGGKDVWKAQQEAATAGDLFVYVKDDTVYSVLGSEEDAAEVFGALP